MACLSRSAISVAANSWCSSSSFSLKHSYPKLGKFDSSKSRIRASTSGDAEDCNVEECAPDKEVGKISVEWLAGEKTRVVGTFPPRKKGWTGYVEKDTAGQTNIYSVEPTVYVAESAISSGTAGSSSDGAENTAAIVAGLALIAVAAASSVLLQVGKSTPDIQTTIYSGPSLSYYITKFKPAEIVQASEPSPIESPSTMESQNSVVEAPQEQAPDESRDTVPEIPQGEVVVESGNQVESPSVDVNNVVAESS
ncbi:protein MAINTENANCE OF PSII UNDER HIGH LIGHT 1 [Silene latifolia]|uniref:protein MAINTENANCE OF PSII UNDER HIGH LIGHT 1 n=1 Tax=Silene latifolia TaxID=37657 RepID=UPI003D78A7EF